MHSPILAVAIKVVHGNVDMATARSLWPHHPEVLMFQRRCLGVAEGLIAKAKALADAGDDKTAVQVFIVYSAFQLHVAVNNTRKTS